MRNSGKLSSPNKISNDIENLLYRFKSNSMKLEDIAEFHILFERIHPFVDGNGGAGRKTFNGISSHTK